MDATLTPGLLLRGETRLKDYIAGPLSSGRLFLWFLFGTGLYGVTVGLWRDPQQGVYVGLKMPLVFLFTAAGTALANGMLAPLLGAPLGVRRSLQALLATFAVTGLVLAALSPLVLFLLWKLADPAGPSTQDRTGYLALVLLHVAVVSVAGLVGVLRLGALLRQWMPGQVARRVLCAWLVLDLFFGAQIAWLMRPFLGDPNLPVLFLRPDALEGNFYEAVWRSLMNLLPAG